MEMRWASKTFPRSILYIVLTKNQLRFYHLQLFGKPNQLYTQGMRPFEQYDQTRKYFAEGAQRDNDANEIQKHLQLYDLSLEEYLVNKCALWLDFRTIDENEPYGTGRRIENASEGITLQIEKKEESAGALNAYIYLIMDAQVNIQNGTYISAVY